MYAATPGLYIGAPRLSAATPGLFAAVPELSAFTFTFSPALELSAFVPTCTPVFHESFPLPFFALSLLEIPMPDLAAKRRKLDYTIGG